MIDPEAKTAFKAALAAVLDGCCPVDGARLQPRAGWGYAFCPTCGEGWQAFHPHPPGVINQQSNKMSWGPTFGVTQGGNGSIDCPGDAPPWAFKK